MTEIYVETNTSLKFTEDDGEFVKKTVRAVIEYENFDCDCEVNVSIVDNDEIREMNKKFRNIDADTDVLSFPFYTRGELENKEFPENMILGDIVVSLEKTLSQAVEYGHGKDRELAFLVVHGTLHLLGYDHEDAGDEEVIEGKQDEILKALMLFIE